MSEKKQLLQKEYIDFLEYVIENLEVANINFKTYYSTSSQVGEFVFGPENIRLKNQKSFLEVKNSLDNVYGIILFMRENFHNFPRRMRSHFSEEEAYISPTTIQNILNKVFHYDFDADFQSQSFWNILGDIDREQGKYRNELRIYNNGDLPLYIEDYNN